ncbi:MAG: glutathione S-transferase C-terminal domain-containing protein [Hyphomicrobium sp.]|uniref:iIsoprene-epoxide--glutathione S-transferase n=1 Tax=Hyphomicrobium sp. TaxID=82 RepID=UPI0039E386BC
MITVYGYVPAWGIADISPYVTKVIAYMTFTSIPFAHKSQDLGRIDIDAPYGKLPYIIDEDGSKVADSNAIIAYLKKKYGDPLDGDLSRSEAATALAWNRLIEEHLYWSGVIEPRWRSDTGWETYIPYIVQGADVTPELRAVLDAFRVRILSGFSGQGMGRRPCEVVFDCFRSDIDAVADYLGDKPYFMGDRLRSIDASVYAMLRHLIDQPHQWPGTGYVAGKRNLAAYVDRIRQEHNI